MSNSNSRKKSRAKDIVFGVIIFLLCGAMCAVAMGLMGVFDKDRNPDNLLDNKADGYIKTQNTARGVEIEVTEDGVIKLSGKATSANTVTVATVALEAGTYTLSGVADPDINNFGMRVMYGVGGVAMANTETATFTLSASETVIVQLYWADEYNFLFNENSTVKPVLVSGDKAGEFYK